MSNDIVQIGKKGNLEKRCHDTLNIVEELKSG